MLGIFSLPLFLLALSHVFSACVCPKTSVTSNMSLTFRCEAAQRQSETLMNSSHPADSARSSAFESDDRLLLSLLPQKKGTAGIGWVWETVQYFTRGGSLKGLPVPNLPLQIDVNHWCVSKEMQLSAFVQQVSPRLNLHWRINETLTFCFAVWVGVHHNHNKNIFKNC